MYKYQKTKRYFAQCADDIKDLAESELKSFGAENTKQSYCGIYFYAERESVYRINYCSALVTRVLAPLVSFACSSDDYLYKTALRINWEEFITSGDTFAVFASVTQSAITHSHFAALRVKDAIADYFRQKYGKRPSVDTEHPDIWINVHIEQNEAVISVDTSGGSLHRRGYRVQSVLAPMIETLAASIIRLSEWDCKRPLYDPFCGSGTILCEAFLKATNKPPGILRDTFGFQKLPDFDIETWLDVQNKARAKIKPLPAGLIAGSDKNNLAIKATYQNLDRIDTKGIIKVKREDVFKIDNLENMVIVCNPPYGIRLNDEEDLSTFYKSIGDFLKQRCKGSTAYIYFGDRKYIKNMGLRSTWKKELSNGGLDGRLVKYDLY